MTKQEFLEMALYAVLGEALFCAKQYEKLIAEVKGKDPIFAAKLEGKKEALQLTVDTIVLYMQFGILNSFLNGAEVKACPHPK